VRLFLIGETGVGKTHTALTIAKKMMDKGKDVLYLDVVERGAEMENKKLQVQMYQQVFTYEELSDKLAVECDLLVIDPLSRLKTLSRRYARQLFVKQGYYEMGEKKVIIVNSQLFDLRGWLYQVSNRMERDFLDAMLEKPFVICTGNTDGGVEDVSGYFALFDIVAMLYTEGGQKKKEDTYRVVIKKWRGDLNMNGIVMSSNELIDRILREVVE